MTVYAPKDPRLQPLHERMPVSLRDTVQQTVALRHKEEFYDRLATLVRRVKGLDILEVACYFNPKVEKLCACLG